MSTRSPRALEPLDRDLLVRLWRCSTLLHSNSRWSWVQVLGGDGNPALSTVFCRSYLDMAKVVVFRYLFWFVLVVVFITGATRISLFGLGYLLACFYLLLFGTAMLRKPARARLVLWDCLILYNITVIISKNMLSVRAPFPGLLLGSTRWVQRDQPRTLPTAPLLRLRAADAEQLLLGDPTLQPGLHCQGLLRP